MARFQLPLVVFLLVIFQVNGDSRCDGSGNLTLSCFFGQVVQFSYARWGRDYQREPCITCCDVNNPTDVTQYEEPNAYYAMGVYDHCWHSLNLTQVLSDYCTSHSFRFEFLNICSFEISSDSWTNLGFIGNVYPCPGIYKYLDYKYYCS